MNTRQELIEVIRRHAEWHKSAAAEALLVKIEAAGCVVVPMEPTKEMILTGETAMEDEKDRAWDSESGRPSTPYGVEKDIYYAMIAASPFAPETAP